MVDIKLERIFDRPLPLDELRGVKQLAKMELLRRGSRLSVQPVTESEWRAVLELADRVHEGEQSPSRRTKKSSRKAAKTQRKRRLDS
jgi:hypothetical protein